MVNSRILFSVGLILLAAFSRLIPHPPNFSPVLSIALFAGAHSMRKSDALWIPVFAMLLSDLVIGLHSLQIIIYALILFVSILGFQLRKEKSISKVFLFSISGSVVFFIISNFFVWFFSGMYSFNFSGLVECYTMAIPFFQNSVAGDLFYSTCLFGGMYILEKSNRVKPLQIA
jgi:hypothetical protein